MRSQLVVCLVAVAALVGLSGAKSPAQEIIRATRPAGKPGVPPAAKPVDDEPKTEHATPDGLFNGKEKWDLGPLVGPWQVARIDFDKKTKVVRCFLTADDSLEAQQRLATLRRSPLVRVLWCDAEGEVVATTKLGWAQSATAGVDIIKIDLIAAREALDEAAIKPETIRQVVISDR